MQSPKFSGARIRPARSLADYLFLRLLRNSVRANMTNNTTALTYWQQLRFYFNKPSNIDVYIAEVGTKRAGYLLLRHENTTTLITEAVEEQFRGHGVATQLIRHAQKFCSDLTAEILPTNIASIALHEATGFRLHSENVRVRIYRYTTPANAGRE